MEALDKKYEKLIDDSVLFDINKDREPSKHQRESSQMVKYLYCYLMAINASKYEKYALEIVETAGVCIKNYDKTKGRFLNYFNKVWRQAYVNAASNDLIEDNYSGRKFSERQKRLYKKYKNYCNIMGICPNSDMKDADAAEALGITIAELKELKYMDASKSFSLDAQYETDDSDMEPQCASKENFVKDMMQKEGIKMFVDHIDSVYSGLQNRQKPMMSTLITSALALEIQDDELLELFKTKSCFDPAVYTECYQKERPLQNKEIAERFGVEEASVSRSWKRFKEKLSPEDYLGD